MFDPSHETHSFGEFTLNVSSHLFLRGQREIPLTRKPFKALLHLVKNPNKLITKDALIDAVCGEEVDLTLDAPKKWIDHIRNALGDQEQIIETVHGEGWRFRPEGLNRETQTASDNIPDTQALQEAEKDQPPARHNAEDVFERFNDRTETFEGWLGGPGLPVFLTLVSCVTATVVLSIVVAKQWGESGDSKAMQAASGAQCLVILIAVLHSWFWNEAKRFRPNEECSEAAIVRAGFKNRAEFENDRANLENDLKKYTRHWRLLLLSWVPLYVVFALGDFGRPAKVLLVIFNLLNTFMLGACFNALNKHVDDQDNEHLAGSVLNIVVLVMLAGVLTALLLGGELGGATLLTGITAGITMALYIGRLQSRFLGPRFWILYLLYSYTAIQPLVLYIDSHPDWGWKILDFALLLKCLLYLYMTWLFQSGLLLFYFARVKRTDTVVRDQRKGFQELLEWKR